MVSDYFVPLSFPPLKLLSHCCNAQKPPVFCLVGYRQKRDSEKNLPKLSMGTFPLGCLRSDFPLTSYLSVLFFLATGDMK